MAAPRSKLATPSSSVQHPAKRATPGAHWARITTSSEPPIHWPLPVQRPVLHCCGLRPWLQTVPGRCEAVDAPEPVGNRACHSLKNCIPRLVAIGVVCFLEVINVHQAQGKRARRSRVTVAFLRKYLEKTAAVLDPGEGIRIHQFLDLLHGFPQFPVALAKLATEATDETANDGDFSHNQRECHGLKDFQFTIEHAGAANPEA